MQTRTTRMVVRTVLGRGPFVRFLAVVNHLTDRVGRPIDGRLFAGRKNSPNLIRPANVCSAFRFFTNSSRKLVLTFAAYAAP